MFKKPKLEESMRKTASRGLTREGCYARLVVIRTKSNNFEVKLFTEEYNHLLTIPLNNSFVKVSSCVICQTVFAPTTSSRKHGTHQGISILVRKELYPYYILKNVFLQI